MRLKKILLLVILLKTYWAIYITNRNLYVIRDENNGLRVSAQLKLERILVFVFIGVTIFFLCSSALMTDSNSNLFQVKTDW